MDETDKEMDTARPDHLPRPTYMPFMTALSLIFFGWGLIGTWIFSVAGLIGLIISLIGWIKELLHEGKNGS
jgi:hypothetical protein